MRYIKIIIIFLVVISSLIINGIVEGKSLSGVTIVIDPGHDSTHSKLGYKYANNPGEEYYTLQVADLLRWYLQQYEGATVYMTRTTTVCPYEDLRGKTSDKYVKECLKKRSEDAAKFEPDYFISLHYNDTNGTQAYYHKTKNHMYFAKMIKDYVRLSLKTIDNTHKADWADETRGPAIFKGPAGVLSKVKDKCEAILLEICGKKEDKMLGGGWLLTAQDIAKGIVAARNKKGFPTPGNGHPDENESVASFSSNSTEMVEGRIPFTVLYEGFPAECEALMSNNKEITYITSPDEFDLEFVMSKPILVIPSGGLFGLSDSTIFKTQLEEYVKAGGTLVVFSQQHGYDFNVLPRGNEIVAYGWLEDQNCQSASVNISVDHPIFSAQTTNTPNVNVDGYFSQWPSDATILLTRTKNLYPSMIMYPYGSGKVIVSSMYSDWAYGHGFASSDEIAIVRDMISWAKNTTKAIPTVQPGQSVTKGDGFA